MNNREEIKYCYNKEYPYLIYSLQRMKDPLRVFYDDVNFYKNIFFPLGLKSGDLVLDVGSCIGRLGHALELTRVKTFGIDINTDAVIEGNRLFGSKKNQSVIADANWMPFPREFDAVVSVDFFEHIPESKLDCVFEQMVRVLRKPKMYHRITTVEDKNIESDSSHVIRWTEDQWKSWFAERGWSTVAPITRKTPFLNKTSYGHFLIHSH